MRRLQEQSIMVPVGGMDQLHLLRLYRDKKKLGAPVLMVAGTGSDSRVFLGEGGGLAHFLAEQGYDVFVADLRGKGKSWPRINHSSAFGYHEIINQDLPALVKKIAALRGPVPQVWISHGLAGVWLCSFYARWGDSLAPVGRMVHFAPRRQSEPRCLKARLWYRWLWRGLGRWLITLYGYLPARSWRLGSSNESAQCYRDFLRWTERSEWRDDADGFRYDLAVHDQPWPPSFYFATEGEALRGDPEDARRFLRELGRHDGRLLVLSRRGGNARDYDHAEMVNHEQGKADHFPLLLAWLQGEG